MPFTFQTYPTPEILARQFAGQFVDWVQQQLQTKKLLYLALSGGSTPQLWFTVLAKDYTNSINWSCLHFFWVDERYVPHNHPESNYGVAYELLFRKVSIPEANLHPIPVTGDPEKDIETYQKDLQEYLPTCDGWPIFDMVLLGMGTDGHTASIFPDSINLFSNNLPVSLSIQPQTGQQRITLTGKVINYARYINILVTGSGKASLLRDIFEVVGKEKYPVSYIRKENTIWLLDQKAAQLLQHN